MAGRHKHRLRGCLNGVQEQSVDEVQRVVFTMLALKLGVNCQEILKHHMT